MENKELSTLPATRLAAKALKWWVPDRGLGAQAKLAAKLAHARNAAREGDWGTYWTTLNHTASGPCLGVDDEWQEEALLGYLDDLCRGYHD